MSLAPSLLDRLPGRADSDAVVLRDSDRAVTRSAFDSGAHALARKLTDANARRVALIGSNSHHWLLTDIACQLANLPLLPLPPFFSDQQMSHALHETGVDLVLLDQSLATSAQTIDQLSVSGFGVSEISDGFYWLHRNVNARAVPSLPQGTGKITFTSGSTGTPKGVCLSNKQLLDQAEALADTVGLAGHCHLSLLPLSILLENVAGVYCSLLAGGEVMVPDLTTLGFRGSSRLDIAKLVAAIDRFTPNSLILMPQLLTALVAAAKQGWHPPKSLTYIAVGGSRVAAATLEAARALGLPVYEGYGLSECASVVSLNVPGNDKPGTAGKPLSHLNVSFREGEIMVEGNPFLGYIGDTSSWHQDTIATGDLGTQDKDGFLHLQGRKKNLLISSFGRNISPEWIESEILAAPCVAEVIVVGDSRPWLTALIFPADDSQDTDIQHWLNQVNRHLPDYARVLAWHRMDQPLGQIDGLLTTNGKPRRDAIELYFSQSIDSLYTEEKLCL